MDVNKHIELLENQHGFLKEFLRLKDYNTSLRIAVINIPVETTKNKTKVNQALKKAKKLATKEPKEPSVHSKKRKLEEEGDDEDAAVPTVPKPKRRYTKRKLLATTSMTIKKDAEDEKQIHSSSLDDETYDNMSDGDDDGEDEGDDDDDDEEGSRIGNTSKSDTEGHDNVLKCKVSVTDDFV